VGKLGAPKGGRPFPERESARDTLPEVPVSSGAPHSQELSLASVPFVAVPREQLVTLPLDARQGFVLSLVDGYYTLEDVIDMCAFERVETIEIISGLLQSGVILLKRRPAGEQSA
jgi:hypothetical protein